MILEKIDLSEAGKLINIQPKIMKKLFGLVEVVQGIEITKICDY